MTVGGVSVPAWPWAWAVLFLALYGLFDLCHWAAGQLGRVRDWWRDRRLDPLPDEDELRVEADEEMGYFDGVPERTWEQMTSRQYPLNCPVCQPGQCPGPPNPGCALTAARERRPPWWEVQQRAAYESLGLDYPSGLMARVRELTL